MAIFHFKDTPENRAHADAINETMKRKAELAKAGTTLMKSKAALPLLLGCSAFALCAGVGGGVALWGYSYITGNEKIALQVTEGVKAALAHTTIKTDGTVTLAGDREVTLKAPAVVSLDPNTALVRVVGQADTPRPSPEQVRQDERPPVAKAGVVTNYTVFKTVKFGAGEVQTGWMFKDGDQQRPSFQYCQYGQFTGNGTTQTNVDIGVNGHISALPNPSPFPAVDLRAAYEAGCIWANDDAAPVAPSTSPATILTRAAKR
jgi:hypothetical protein